MLTDEAMLEVTEEPRPQHNCIAYLSKRQTVVAQSSSEAEYVGACKVTQVIVHKRRLMDQIRFTQPDATQLLSDSEACKSISEEWKVGERIKHVDKKFHYVRHQVIVDESVRIVFLLGAENVADMETKFLDKPILVKHRSAIMNG